MTTLPNIILQHQKAIGLEAFGSLVENVRRLHDRRLYDRLKARLRDIFTATRMANRINPSIDKAVLKHLEAVNFMNLSGYTVYVPVGFAGKVNDYIGVLERNQTYFERLIKDMLTPAHELVGMLVNNPSLLTDATLPPNSFDRAPLRDVKVEEVSKAIAEMFDPKSGSDAIPFTQAYDRIADFDMAAKRVSNLQDAIGRYSPAEVEKVANTLFEVASTLADTLKQYPNVTKRTTDALSNCMYECAVWVELYGIHLDQVNTMAVAIRDTETKIKETSKK